MKIPLKKPAVALLLAISTTGCTTEEHEIGKSADDCSELNPCPGTVAPDDTDTDTDDS